MPKVNRLTVHVLGERNFPIALTAIPTELMFDVDILVTHMRERYPAATYEQLIRYIWVRGLDALRTAVMSNNLPDPDKTPTPKTTPYR